MIPRARKQRGYNKPELSNVHCQDESAVSPSFISCYESQEMSVLSDVYGMDPESETLPSDWLSGLRSASSIEKSPLTMDCLNSRIGCRILDENSQGSDSGFGNEIPRRQSSPEPFNRYKNRPKLPLRSVSNKFSVQTDDGFAESEDSESPKRDDACSSLCATVSERLDWNKGLISADEQLSPFTLHRRNSASGSFFTPKGKENSLTGCPIVTSRSSQAKRLSIALEVDEEEESDSESMHTTPKRRRSVQTLRRATSSIETIATRTPSTPVKRCVEEVENIDVKPLTLSRSISERPMPRMDEKKIARIIDANDNNTVTGDDVSLHIDSSRFELRTLSAEYVANLIQKSIHDKERYKFIDCRYPYEYDGGHLKGAVNLHTEEMVYNEIFKPAIVKTKMEQNACSFRSACNFSINKEKADGVDRFIKPTRHSPFSCLKNHVNQQRTLIFYCEFSSKRAPHLAKFLRAQDRNLNYHVDYSLFYPDLYIMKGGYHEFQKQYADLCEPVGYVKMYDKRFWGQRQLEMGQHKRQIKRKQRVTCRSKFTSPSALPRISPLQLKGLGEKLPASPPRLLEWS